VLLRGTKHFRLWPPSEAPRMHTVRFLVVGQLHTAAYSHLLACWLQAGTVSTIHPNGRIVYQGQVSGQVI
jgi:hypothetical protein